MIFEGGRDRYEGGTHVWQNSSGFMVVFFTLVS